MNDKIMTLEELLENQFTEQARPPLLAMRRLISKGQFPKALGTPFKPGKKWLIIPPSISCEQNQQSQPVAYITLTGDPEIDEILKDGCT